MTDWQYDEVPGAVLELPFASRGDLGLHKPRVIQCALSRICGVCGDSLGRPVAFLGSADEEGRNAFHFPPCHEACADRALAEWATDGHVYLGHQQSPREWRIVTTSGFEFIRMAPEDVDRRPVFAPNSILASRSVPAAG